VSHTSIEPQRSNVRRSQSHCCDQKSKDSRDWPYFAPISTRQDPGGVSNLANPEIAEKIKQLTT